MELEKILDSVREIVCSNPFWTIFGAIFTPTAFIAIRKFYLEYFSNIELEIQDIKILPNNSNNRGPRGTINFSLKGYVRRKTRKLIHLEGIECRILTDTITTKWYPDSYSPRRIDLTNNRKFPFSCSFFESPNYNIYQFEIRFKEDGKNKNWSLKSKKYNLESDQLIEVL